MDEIFFFTKTLMIFIILLFCDGGDTDMLFMADLKNETLKMTCDQSEVINIKAIQYQNFNTNCQEPLCNLTKPDRHYIEKCNHKMTCNVSLKLMNSCLYEKGRYNINYSCNRLAHVCDFEEELCNWTLTSARWKKASENEGYRDHTTGTGNGKYIFINVNNNNNTDHLRSDVIHGNKDQCLSFWFYAIITGSCHEMRLDMFSSNGSSNNSINSWKINSTTRVWTRIDINLNETSDYRLVFRTVSVKKSTHTSTFIIDDISIINLKCRKIWECDFESHKCDWSNSSNWIFWKGSTETPATGPSSDHSTVDVNGSYMYMKASSMTNDEKVNTTSPKYFEKGELCFVFWYNMFGAEMGSLNVYNISENGHSMKLFSKSNNQGPQWHSARIDIRTDQTFKIIFEGQRGKGDRSDIAIDDMSLHPGNCSGFISHKKSCNSVNEQIKLDECNSHFLPLENITFDFRPKMNECREYIAEGVQNICKHSNFHTYCNTGEMVKQNPKCFTWNRLMIEYSCEEMTAKIQNNNSRNTVIFVGLSAGVGVFFIALICTIVLMAYRCRRSHRKLESRRTPDYTDKWETDNEGTITNSADVNNASRPNISKHHASSNPLNAQNCGNVSPSKSINMVKRSQLANIPGDEYAMVDRLNTGNIKRITVKHGEASAREMKDVQDIDGYYTESGAGHYDISGNSRHMVKDPIYDHSVEDTYDTANHARQQNNMDDTYDHMF